MEISEILKKCDHTLLKPEATIADIKKLCEDAIKYHTASVCIPPSFVKRASEMTGGRLKICTVIGFPNGYSTTAVKAFEAEDAIKNGADEIDVVINIGRVKEKDWDFVEEELKTLRRVSRGHILKVIIETCLLTEEEKIKLCEIVTKSSADFIKTSTGFSSGGATLDDVKLLKSRVGSGVKVKAAGGIKDIKEAEAFLEAGAARLGTSRVVKAAKAMEEK